MADLTGETLGKYQLIERLGRGGMADVYRAYQPGLDRLVAVKVMHSHLADEAGFVTRFEREAKSVAELRHPHIVQVIDFDVQDDVHYMVMEYIEGASLKAWLRDLASRGERLPVYYAVDIAAKLADALAYAHGEGMVHRDIKPANVLLRRPDYPVLSDFGIARIVGMTGLTAEGATIGTPAYMSPEQCRGETADERSDIYALGVVLFEMLAGHPPYDADTPYAVILKHINDPIPSPRQRVPDLPDFVERIILKSLAKDPEHRFSDAAAMHDALLTARDELAEITPPTALSVTPPVGLRAPAAPTIAHEPAPTLPDELAPPEAMPAAEVEPTLQAERPAPPLEMPAAEAEPTLPSDRVATPPEMVSAAEAAPIPPEAIEPAPPRKRGLALPLLAVGALFVIGLIVGGALLVLPGLLGGPEAEPGPGEAEEPEVEVEPPRPVEEPGEEGPEEGPVEYSEVDELLDVGFRAWDEGDPDRAIEAFSRALEIDPNNMEALVNRADLYIELGDAESAQRDIDRAMELDPGNPYLYVVIAHSHWFIEDRYDQDAALNALNRAIELDPGFARAYRERAKLYAWEFEDMDRALEDINHAIEMEPEEPGGYLDRAFLRVDVGDLVGASEDFRRAYDMTGEVWMLEEAAREQVRAGDLLGALDTYEYIRGENPGDPYFLIGQGYILYRKGELDRIWGLVDEAVALGGGDDPGLHYLIGLTRLRADNPEEAIAEFESLRDVDPDDYWYPFFNPEFGHSLETDLAMAYIKAGRYEEAIALADEKSGEDPEWFMPHYVRGLAFARLGDIDPARGELELALELTGDPHWRGIITQELERLG